MNSQSCPEVPLPEPVIVEGDGLVLKQREEENLPTSVPEGTMEGRRPNFHELDPWVCHISVNCMREGQQKAMHGREAVLSLPCATCVPCEVRLGLMCCKTYPAISMASQGLKMKTKAETKFSQRNAAKSMPHS